MRVTTKKGDEGLTELLFGVKVPKTDPQMTAMGDLDELNAGLGSVRVLLADCGEVDRAQAWLVTLMGEVAMPTGAEEKYRKAGFSRITDEDVAALEGWMASLEGNRDRARGRDWLRPGADGADLAARWQVARTLARRAERSVWSLPEEQVSREGRILLNRLSDWCWLRAGEIIL